jgi:hypothetical protein
MIGTQIWDGGGWHDEKKMKRKVEGARLGSSYVTGDRVTIKVLLKL